MFVELHLLQNFAPSNLNRDDTGSPKDCEFGGARRARISSQCLKRTARMYVRDEGLLPADRLAGRSRRFPEDLTRRLVERGRDETESRAVVTAALGGLNLSITDTGGTQYLLFLAENELKGLLDAYETHWEALAASTGADGDSGGRGAKKVAKAAVPPAVVKALEAVLDGGRAADLAMYGRMLADMPAKNIDAASQVAHAISTHRVNTEFDYYTAVDDLNPEDTAGAGMIGTVEFNSACYYRYSNVDTDQLVKNLGGDSALAATTLDAFLRGSILAVPDAKQNSMAAQNPPSLVMTVVRDRGQWSLTNAFEKAVGAGGGEGIVQQSVRALDAHFAGLQALYGEYAGIRQVHVATLHSENLDSLRPHLLSAVPEVVRRTVDAAFPGGAA